MDAAVKPLANFIEEAVDVEWLPGGKANLDLPELPSVQIWEYLRSMQGKCRGFTFRTRMTSLDIISSLAQQFYTRTGFKLFNDHCDDDWAFFVAEQGDRRVPVLIVNKEDLFYVLVGHES